MDAKSTRTANIRHLVKAVGGPAKFSRLYGDGRWPATLVTNWCSARKPKPIGHVAARAIEEAVRKPHGWLDIPHDLEGAPALDRAKSPLHPPRLDSESLSVALEIAQAVVEAEGLEFIASERADLVIAALHSWHDQPGKGTAKLLAVSQHVRELLSK